MSVYAAELIAKVSADTSSAESAISKFSDTFNVFKNGIGGTAIIVGTLAAGVAIATTTMAGDFQQAMTKLVTSAGETAGPDGIGKVSAGILKMAVDTGTSTAQLAQSMLFVESTGNRGAAGLRILQAAAEGAKLENADLTVVSRSLIAVMEGYHMPADQATNAMNGLVAAAKDGGATLQELTGAMAAVLPTASSLHVPFAQVAGAIDVMTNKQVSAEQAAQNLAHVLVSLEAPNKVAEKAMTAVGLSAQGVRDSLVSKGLPAALQMIEDSVGKKFPASSVEYNQALKSILGGLVGFKVAAQLTGPSLKDLQRNTEDITKAMADGKNGILGWTDVQQNFNFRMAQAREVVETLGIKLGTVLLPIATQAAGFFVDNFVPTLQQLADAFNKPNKTITDLSNSIKTYAIGTFNELKTILFTDVIPAVSSLANFIVNTVIPAAVQLDIWFGKTILPVLHTLADVIKQNVVPAVEKIAQSFISNIIPAIEHLVGVIVPVLQPALKAIGWVLSTIVAPAIGVVLPILGFLINIIADILTPVAAVVGWLINFGVTVLSVVGNVIGWFVGLKDGVVNAFNTIKTFLIGAANAIVGVITGMVNTVLGWFKWLYDHNIYFREMVESIKAIVTEVKNWLGSTWQTITASLAFVWKQISGDATAAWNTFAGIIKNVIATVSANVSGVITAIEAPFAGVLTTMEQIGKSIIQSIINGITGSLGSLANTLGGVKDTIVNSVGGWLGFTGDTTPAKPATVTSIWSGPKHAAGTSNAPGGLSLVGEQGPELVHLPRGAQVYTASQTAGMFANQSQSGNQNGMGTGQPINVVLEIDGQRIGHVLVPYQVDAIKRALGVRVA